MGLLKNIFRSNPERQEQRGDACVLAGEWGRAKLAYEAALDALEKTAAGESPSRARILEKLHGSVEALAGEHVRNAREMMESGYEEDARELLELALDLARAPSLQSEIKGLLQAVDESIPEQVTERPAPAVLPVPDHDPEHLESGDPEPPEFGDQEFGDQETFLALVETLPPEAGRAYLSYGPAFREGYLALNRGDFDLAAAALSWAMEEDPSGESYIPLELGTALLNADRPEEARQWLESFLEHHPDALPGYQVLCEVLWETEAFDQAEALLDTCPDELKHSLAHILLRGEGLSRAGGHSEAAALYEAFMKEYGRQEPVLQALAGTYEALGRLQEARALYVEIMNDCRSCHKKVDPVVRRRFADISFDLNERSTALLESYISLAREDPSERAFCFRRISDIYEAMGNREEARRFRGFARRAEEEAEQGKGLSTGQTEAP